jgi:hypothetical protein
MMFRRFGFVEAIIYPAIAVSISRTQYEVP